ncbi:AMIN-like domain-containing (lipo)protein [Georgenia yuyongxinii]
MRRLVRVLLALVFALALVGPATSASAHAGPYCGITWGSLAKQDTDLSTAQLHNVRTGRHACFDRMVLDFRGTADVQGYTVAYVDKVTSESGATVPLRGGARLMVTVNAPAYDEAGNSTYNPANRRHLTDVRGYRTFRQLAYVQSFEGYTTLGLGVRARLPFRVFVLDGGPGHTTSRLVVDVAHRW